MTDSEVSPCVSLQEPDNKLLPPTLHHVLTDMFPSAAVPLCSLGGDTFEDVSSQFIFIPGDISVFICAEDVHLTIVKVHCDGLTNAKCYSDT